jgi:hypothetical protein
MDCFVAMLLAMTEGVSSRVTGASAEYPIILQNNRSCQKRGNPKNKNNQSLKLLCFNFPKLNTVIDYPYFI